MGRRLKDSYKAQTREVHHDPDSRRHVSPGVVSVEPTVSAREAARVMRDQDTGDVVVTRDGHLEGILTDRDLVVRLVAEELDPEVKVTEICTSEPITIDADQSLRAAATTMRQYSIRRLPVCEGDQVVGFISLGDLAQYTGLRRHAVRDQLRCSESVTAGTALS